MSTSTAQLASIRPRSSAGTPLEKTLLSGTPSSGMGAGSGISLPPGYDERRGRGDRGNPNLDPEMDLKMNKEFYMHNDVRPPYTYAALIRYVSGAKLRAIEHHCIFTVQVGQRLGSVDFNLGIPVSAGLFLAR